MKKIIPLIIFLTILSGYSQAQELSERSPLTLTITADKEAYEAGEQITITLHIKNVNKVDVVYGLHPVIEQPEYDGHGRIFFQNGEDIVVQSKTKGHMEGHDIQRYAPVGAKQKVLILKPNEEYSQSFIVSRYFEFAPDVYGIYLTSILSKEWELYLERVQDGNVQDGNKGTSIRQSVITSNIITIKVTEKP